MKKWYVLRVQVGKEANGKEALERKIETHSLSEFISKIMVPKEKVTEIRGGKKKVVERKLYPGYLLVEMELNDQTWLAVRETTGVGDFLGGRKPIPMSQPEIDRLLLSGTAGAEAEKPKIKIAFKKGDNVRIKEGPFENFDGTVEEIIPTKGIIKVIITIFGRATSVELEHWQAEAT
ncbi:MAG: transcription termination/antitermination protein NusG [Planctomycetota bacterium]